MTQTTTTKLERTAARIAKDPKAIARISRSLADLRAGNSVAAFEALAQVKQQRTKARQKYA